MIFDNDLNLSGKKKKTKATNKINFKHPLVIILVESTQPIFELSNKKNLDHAFEEFKDVDIKDLINDFINEITEKTYDLISKQQENPKNKYQTIFVESATNSKSLEILRSLLENTNSMNKLSDSLQLKQQVGQYESRHLFERKSSLSTKFKSSNILGVLKICSRPKSSELKSTLPYWNPMYVTTNDIKDMFSKFFKFHYK